MGVGWVWVGGWVVSLSVLQLTIYLLLAYLLTSSLSYDHQFQAAVAPEPLFPW